MFLQSIEKMVTSYVKVDDKDFKREDSDGTIRWYVGGHGGYTVIGDHLTTYHKLEDEYNSMGCV